MLRGGAADGSGTQATETKSERRPKPNLCRSVSFAHFAAGSLSFSANVAPGACAPAFRFVNSLTGQQTDFVKLLAAVVS